MFFDLVPVFFRNFFFYFEKMSQWVFHSSKCWNPSAWERRCRSRRLPTPVPRPKKRKRRPSPPPAVPTPVPSPFVPKSPKEPSRSSTWSVIPSLSVSVAVTSAGATHRQKPPPLPWRPLAQPPWKAPLQPPLLQSRPPLRSNRQPRRTS